MAEPAVNWPLTWLEHFKANTGEYPKELLVSRQAFRDFAEWLPGDRVFNERESIVFVKYDNMRVRRQ